MIEIMTDTSKEEFNIELFRECRKILKCQDIVRVLLATTSLLFGGSALKSLIRMAVSEEWIAYAFTIIPFAVFGAFFNAIAQARGANIANALLKDWADLPKSIHISIILTSGALLLMPKIIEWVKIYLFPNNNFFNRNTIANK